jgi:hypothetical protein
MRAKCAHRDPICERERRLVHTHELTLERSTR